MYDPIWMILIIPLAGIFEILINYFFTKKIYFVSKNDAKRAALNGAFATFLFSTLIVGLGVIIGASGWYNNITYTCIYVIFSGLSIALGNYVGTRYVFARLKSKGDLI